MKFSGINSFNVNTYRNNNLQTMMKHIPFNKTAYNAPVINLASNIGSKEQITNMNTRVINSVIPLNIYQTWYTKNLPPIMNAHREKLKLLNPAFTFHLYDDSDCLEFIKKELVIPVVSKLTKHLNLFFHSLWEEPFTILQKLEHLRLTQN